MGIYDELKERGIIAQVTNEEKVRELLNGKVAKFYIGFDPTADSLHVGHFVQMIIMSHLQRAGHIPIALFGGGTGVIGDPSFKDDMRKMLTREEIDYNVQRFKEQMSSLVDFSDGKAIMVDNKDWLLDLNYVNFLREVGVHFSVNKMLAAECYKKRMEKGLTFFELNYMLMQSYDFLVLNRKYGCSLELGGDDQWSNIIGGVELIRKSEGKEAYGMTFALLTTSEGKKMGKTEKGALWLDKNKTSVYDFYQYFRNVDDKDVIRCLKILTFLPLDTIKELEKLEGSDINKAKEILAFEVTKSVHGEEEATRAQDAARSIFGLGQNSDDMPSTNIKKDFLIEGVSICDILVMTGLAASKGEGRRLINQGGISLMPNGEELKKVDDINLCLTEKDFSNGQITIKKGKKIYHKIVIE